MAITYSTNLRLTLIGTGDQAGTWGNTTNTNLGTLIEQAIAGFVSQTVSDSAGSPTSLTISDGTSSVARNMIIALDGALSAPRDVILPTNKKLYFVHNNTTGGHAVTVKCAGQTGVTVPAGAKALLACNGTDIIDAANYFSTFIFPSSGSISNLSIGSSTITTLSVSNTINGSISGNAGTVTNGVYTTGSQTIGGQKTFSTNPIYSASNFQYHQHQSDHIAYVKKTGAYNWYWRRNDTGLNFGANEVNQMELSDSGSLIAYGDMRAPIFYDANNTAYYLDPANTTTSGVFAGGGGFGITTTMNYADYGRFVVSGGQAGTSTSSIALYTQGSAQGERADIALYSTFVGTGDNAPRRTADILAGFNGGAWGNEYLSFNVGNNGSGNDSKVVTSEKMRIRSDGKVGIGTNNPGATLDVNGTFRIANDGGSNYGALWTMRNMSSGATNIDKNFRINPTGTLEIINSAYDSIRFQFFDDGRLYCGSTVNAPSFYDSDNSAYYLDPANTGTALNVAGSIVAAGNVTAYSDIRVKANIEPIHGALDKLSQINGVTYTRTDLDDKERRYGGVIAQEIEAVLPEAVFDDGVKKAVDYNATIGLLIQAVKEQQAQIEELKLALSQIKGN